MIIFLNESVLCGCSKGKALLLRLSIQDKDFIQEKEYDCDTDTAVKRGISI